MIQLLSAPYTNSFARNPLVYRFRATDASGDIYRAIGVRSELRSDPATVIPLGDTLTLNWTEPDGTTGSETFTAVASPSGTNDIPDGSGFGSESTYYSEVVDILNAHPVLSPLFSFSTSLDGSVRSLWEK